MNSAPKITVLKIQEVVYTLILIFFILTLLICLFLMFSRRNADTGAKTGNPSAILTEESFSDSESADTISTGAASVSDTYIAGVYTSSITLGASAVDVQVTIDSNQIKAIELVNLSDAVQASYPLVTSAFENLTSQILEKQKLDGITCSAQNRYTSQLLLNAISKALSLAKAEG